MKVQLVQAGQVLREWEFDPDVLVTDYSPNLVIDLCAGKDAELVADNGRRSTVRFDGDLCWIGDVVTPCIDGAWSHLSFMLDTYSAGKNARIDGRGPVLVVGVDFETRAVLCRLPDGSLAVVAQRDLDVEAVPALTELSQTVVARRADQETRLVRARDKFGNLWTYYVHCWDDGRAGAGFGYAQEKPTKFRKKPVVVDAYRTPVAVDIPTLEGTMRAKPGDWIITGVEGERYPCRADIFERTYEAVADGA